MEKLELNSKVWYIKFYMFLTNKSKWDLPKDVCSLRNTLFFTFAIFVLIAPIWLVWSTIVYKMDNFSESTPPMMVLFINLLGFGIIMAIFPNTFIIEGGVALLLSSWFIFGGITLSIIFGAIVGVVILGRLIYEKIKKAYPRTSEKKSIFKVMRESYKNKFCTPIKWK